jgi:D-lactate dehydrogenase (cytochrome)
MSDRAGLNNRIRVSYPDLRNVECPAVEDSDTIREAYQPFLADESRLQGTISGRLFFPRSTQEAALAVRQTLLRGQSLTVGGGRTGIVGGAVPVESDHLLSTVNLKFAPRLSYHERYRCWALQVGAGTTLEEVNKILQDPALRPPGLFYPVDPTETTSSIGGNVATNASGARTLHYGPTRNWVLGITVVLPDGGVVRINRGQVISENHRFILEGKETREIPVPPLFLPDTKHVAGYHLQEDMDLLDLFIGGEGTLGIITEIDLRLVEPSEPILALCLFLPEEKVLPAVERLKGSSVFQALALEYMDRNSLNLLTAYREEAGQSSGVPNFPADTESVLYAELEGEPEALFDELAALLGELEIDLDSTWSGSSRGDLEAMKAFRHALPERINSLISARKEDIPEITKIGTDMAVPDAGLPDIMGMYRNVLDTHGLDYCIFGHIGNGHLHVNILPRTREEMLLGKNLYRLFAKKAVALGGSVAAEHGIGRLKREFLRIQYSEEDIRKMQRIKDVLDPAGLLNPGILFERVFT